MNMIYHLNDGTKNLCGQSGKFILVETALNPTTTEHFNCVECHKIVSGGQKHVRPEVEDDDIR